MLFVASFVKLLFCLIFCLIFNLFPGEVEVLGKKKKIAAGKHFHLLEYPVLAGLVSVV